MLQLDLRQAEVALAAGRLDEAFRLLGHASVRQHRDGQRLLDRLVEALLGRARAHLADRQIGDARAGLEKATQCADKQIEIAHSHKPTDQQKHSLLGDVPESSLAEVAGGRDGEGAPGAPNGISQYRLHVDGFGSLLVFTSNAITVGTASSSSRHDIILQSGGADGPLTIRRSGGDYFAESETPLIVNRQPTLRRLLGHGDSITLVPRESIGVV